MTTTMPVPTAEQIATLDPDTDFDAAFAAGVTYFHRRDHVLTVACPRPRCAGRVGVHCTTPNGWSAGLHKERADVAYGRTRKARPHRLTDRQAEWLELAAESDDHRLYAPGMYANFSGDAAQRQTADAMENAGLIAQVGTTRDDERMFELTDAGWRLYWMHRLVIRHGTPPGHPDTCPCVTTAPVGAR